MRYPTREFVDFLRVRYPEGTRIRCEQMEDPWGAIPSGTSGTIQFIDDVATIHVKWDNGRTLGLVYGEDEFTVIEEEMSGLTDNRTV